MGRKPRVKPIFMPIGRATVSSDVIAHASTHELGGSDVVTLDQSQITDLATDLALKADKSITISSGTGLTGGGDLSANRSFALSHLGIESLTDPGADRIMFWDDSETAAKWLTVSTGLQISAANLTTNDGAIDHDALLNFVANEHIDWTNATSALLTTQNIRTNAGSLDFSVGINQDGVQLFTTTASSIYMGTNISATSRTLPFTICIGVGSLGVAQEGAATNWAIGYYTFGALTTGVQNFGMGTECGRYLYTGSYNMLGGHQAGYSCNGDYNIVLGWTAGFYQENGDNNVFIGAGTGKGSTWYDISGCVWIGYNVGLTQNHTNNTLQIHNSDSANPLVYGEFDNGLVKINGTMTVASTISGALTIGAGTAGVDYAITFDGETNDGTFGWMEDEDYFEFLDDVMFDEHIAAGTSPSSDSMILGYFVTSDTTQHLYGSRTVLQFDTASAFQHLASSFVVYAQHTTGTTALAIGFLGGTEVYQAGDLVTTAGAAGQLTWANTVTASTTNAFGLWGLMDIEDGTATNAISIYGSLPDVDTGTITNKWAGFFYGDVGITTGNKLYLEAGLFAAGDTYLVYSGSVLDTYVDNVNITRQTSTVFQVGVAGSTKSFSVSTSGPSASLGNIVAGYNVHIDHPSNALTGSSVDISGLGLVVQRQDNTNNNACGMGFAHSTDLTSVGAAIIHERVGAGSEGKLHFATKPDNAAASDIPIVFTIDQDGHQTTGAGTKCDGLVRRMPAEVQTTDATQTTADSITLLDENTYHCKAYVVGVKSDGSDRASYEIACTVYRTGAGGATLQGAVTAVHSQESNAAWDATFTVNGNDLRVSVTGVAATTVEWVTTLQYINMSN